MGGSIGEGTWQPYTNDVRKKHLKPVDGFLDSLTHTISEKARHSERLAFMADNVIRQLGKPRIGDFSDRVRPGPLHCEINAWQDILDIIYYESVQRNVFHKFTETLSATVGR